MNKIILLILAITIWGSDTVLSFVGSFLGWSLLAIFIVVLFEQIFNKQNKGK